MLCKEEKCFGCFACASVCPRHAISFKENADGAMCPQIDETACIGCRVCEKVCPALHLPQGHRPLSCYAAWSGDRVIIGKAASGGIISTIYKWILERDGVVFGTRYMDGELRFAYAEDGSASDEFAGSKYVHAYVGEAYRQVKQFLKNGRKVVFVGTPCQIAGLRSYLGKEYEQLFLIDIICHGVSPQIYLREYVKNMLGMGYDKVLFRGEQGNKIAVYREGKLIYCKEKWYDPYSMAYAKGMISRENCYDCPFASMERQGDITAGDFWGLNKESLASDVDQIPFVSLVFVNSAKGMRVFHEISNRLVCEERKIEEAIAGNRQLQEPCKKHDEREWFLKEYKRVGFYKAIAVTKLFKETQKANAINKIKSPLRIIRNTIEWRKRK